MWAIERELSFIEVTVPLKNVSLTRVCLDLFYRQKLCLDRETFKRL